MWPVTVAMSMSPMMAGLQQVEQLQMVFLPRVSAAPVVMAVPVAVFLAKAVPAPLAAMADRFPSPLEILHRLKQVVRAPMEYLPRALAVAVVMAGWAPVSLVLVRTVQTEVMVRR